MSSKHDVVNDQNRTIFSPHAPPSSKPDIVGGDSTKLHLSGIKLKSKSTNTTRGVSNATGNMLSAPPGSPVNAQSLSLRNPGTRFSTASSEPILNTRSSSSNASPSAFQRPPTQSDYTDTGAVGSEQFTKSQPFEPDELQASPHHGGPSFRKGTLHSSNHLDAPLFSFSSSKQRPSNGSAQQDGTEDYPEDYETRHFMAEDDRHMGLKRGREDQYMALNDIRSSTPTRMDESSTHIADRNDSIDHGGQSPMTSVKRQKLDTSELVSPPNPVVFYARRTITFTRQSHMDELHKKWTNCTLEEWKQAGNGIHNFSSVLKFVMTFHVLHRVEQEV